MSLLLLAAAAVAPPPAKPETIFECSFGKKHATVTYNGTALTYRYGPRGKPELTIDATPASNTIFYHRTLYPRGEDQILRFVKGEYSYSIFAHWEAPMQYMTTTTPETIEAELSVYRNDQVISTRPCKSGGDMREHPVFKLLPDTEPESAGREED